METKNYEHYCSFCGKKLERKRFPKNNRLEDYNAFKKRKYCNQECMRKGFLKIGYFEDRTWSNSHTTSRRINNLILKQGCCEKCGSTKSLDVHHKDHNYQNNSIDNLQVICRSCHNKEHRQAAKCIICGNKVKGHGYCDKHYQRFKKYGDPRKVKKCNGQIIELEN